MAEKLQETPELQEIKIQRPKRAKLTSEESLRRMDAFHERKEQIVAAVRKSQNRSLPA